MVQKSGVTTSTGHTVSGTPTSSGVALSEKNALYSCPLNGTFPEVSERKRSTVEEESTQAEPESMAIVRPSS